MTEPHLTLFSGDLLSKWGFNDGDDPDDWLDWCEAQGIDYTKFDFPWAAVVRQHLLPAIEQDVTVVDIETCHNPIRVDTLHGVNVVDYWRDNRRNDSLLTPDHVEVPMVEALRIALDEAGLTEPPRSPAGRSA